MHIVQPSTRRATMIPGAHEQLLAGALAAAARGWRVLPLRPAFVDDELCFEGRFAKVSGKAAAITRWPELATTDATTIVAWWAESRLYGANPGIATGSASDLTIIDLDVRLDDAGQIVLDGRAEMLKLEQRHGELPRGPRTRTSRGGLQLYCRHTPRLRNGAGLLPGIDTRSEGGLVPVPPSIHRSGARYRWVEGTENLPVPALPEWLVQELLDGAVRKKAERVRAKAAETTTMRTARQPSGPSCDFGMPQDASDVEARARRYVAAMPPSYSGHGGHQALWYATCRAMHGFSPGLDDDTTYRVLIDAFNDRCEPPWSERELLHKIEDARQIDEPERWRVETKLVATAGIEEML